MKSKTSGKKLTLNKKTIAELNIDKMKSVYGGVHKTTGVPGDLSGYILTCVVDTQFYHSYCCL